MTDWVWVSVVEQQQETGEEAEFLLVGSRIRLLVCDRGAMKYTVR